MIRTRSELKRLIKHLVQEQINTGHGTELDNLILDIIESTGEDEYGQLLIDNYESRGVHWEDDADVTEVDYFLDSLTGEGVLNYFEFAFKNYRKPKWKNDPINYAVKLTKEYIESEGLTDEVDVSPKGYKDAAEYGAEMMREMGIESLSKEACSLINELQSSTTSD